MDREIKCSPSYRAPPNALRRKPECIPPTYHRCRDPMPRSDFAFANDIRAATELRTPRTARMLLYTSLGILVVGLTWANFAILDEVKRGNGRVIPSRQTRVVQTLEGGIVSVIMVREGDIVSQGQNLMRID